MALQWTQVSYPLDKGVSQNDAPQSTSDDSSPDVLLDAQFDIYGGIQARHPYAAMSNAIVGGGTLANCRKMVANGTELLCFTSDSLYSWSPTLAAWVLKATYLAAKVAERDVFNTPGDQHDYDRAELGGITFFCWAEYLPAGETVAFAAIDTATGAVVFPPTSVPQGVSSRPRLVALQTRVLFLFQTGTDSTTNPLVGFALNPAAIALTGIATVVGVGTFNHFYDVCQIIGTDSAAIVYRRQTTTSYDVAKISSALVTVAQTKALALVGSCAISSSPSGTSLTIMRSNAGTVTADLVVVSTLADGAAVNVNVGTTGSANNPGWMTCAHRSVQVGGQWTCYLFWDNGVSPISTNTNAFNDAGTQTGALAFPPFYLSPASRAFDANGRVFVWLAFAEASNSFILGNQSRLQNTYFLYRDDFLLVAKAAADNSAGRPQTPARLPGVAVTAAGSYAWCGGIARLVSLGTPGATAFGARAPRDIVTTFDTNEARRAARFGQTLYITGGEILQYDGQSLFEVGFHVSPWAFAAVASGAGGGLAAGSYAYKLTLRYVNGRGDTERSTTAAVSLPTAAAGNITTIFGIPTIFPSHKLALNPYRVDSPIVFEAWRTVVNPTAEAPFYLVTSKDPTATTNPNRYLVNDPSGSALPTFTDSLTDAVASTHEINPENNGVLVSLAPPAATIIHATADRLFLAGIAGQPDTVWYSRQRNDGEVASFNDALTFLVPTPTPTGGDITAVWFMDQTCIVFRQTAIYSFPGAGFDNLGNGQNYGPARVISTEVGAQNAESVMLMATGIVFKSNRGWYLLDRSHGVQYIGADVSAYDGDVITSTRITTGAHQLRTVSASRMTVFDFERQTWAEWTINDALGGTMFGGVYTYLTATGPKQEQAAYTAMTYGLDVESAWLKLADLQGFSRVRRIYALGEFRSPFALRMRVARDYQADGAGNPLWFDDVIIAATPATVGSAMQLMHSPTQQQGESYKVRLTAVALATSASIATAAPSVTVFEALVAGTAGNAITLRYVGDAGGSSVSLVEAGNAVTIHYNPSTTTFAAVEALITSSSTLIRVRTSSGSSAAILSGYAFGPTALTGGAAIGASPPTGEAVRLTAIGFEVGQKPGMFKRLPAAQRG